MLRSIKPINKPLSLNHPSSTIVNNHACLYLELKEKKIRKRKNQCFVIIFIIFIIKLVTQNHIKVMADNKILFSLPIVILYKLKLIIFLSNNNNNNNNYYYYFITIIIRGDDLVVNARTC